MTEVSTEAISNKQPKNNEIEEAVDVLVMIPTGNEAAVIQNFFNQELPNLGFTRRRRIKAMQGITYFIKNNDDGTRFIIAVFCADFQGNVKTASYAAMLIMNLVPKLIISAGIAGSLDASKAWIGDIVLPTKIETAKITKIYHAKNEAPEKPDGIIAHIFAPDFNSIKKNSNSIPIRIDSEKRDVNSTMMISNLDISMIEDALIYKGSSNDINRRKQAFNNLQATLTSKFNLNITPPDEPRLLPMAKTFSWDKVLDSPRVYDFLKGQLLSNDNVCVEMESLGLSIVSDLINLKFPHDILIVRGISDVIGCKGDTDQKDEPMEGFCREYALKNVATTVVKIIAEELDE